MSKPTGLIANSGIELLTWGTPNGHKASIILEELKEAYGKPDYVHQGINIGENIQKEPWFTKLGPNGRIPVIVDHDKGGLSVMEGAAILTYLTRHYDPKHIFSFTEDPDLSYCEQWVAWQHANHFYRLAKERIAYPTQRYVGETERLFGVLDTQLKGKEYLVGNKYSIADIASFSWVNIAYVAGLDINQFPDLKKWWQRIWDRPAVQRACSIPSESKLINANFPGRLDDPEFKESEDKLKDALKQAREQYNYKYASP
ncbi:hypothetical protein ANO11243_003410 [Dothideomycetidae sp. 11243]|nr:hypothetical protein ANO11243_003410 [fungal sp. No.11243]